MNRKVLINAISLSLAAACLAPQLNGASKTCDRACLTRTLNSFMQAVLKHNPKLAPLAPSFRYTENADVVQPGEGIWKTASGLGQVQRYYVDPVNGQAVYFGHIEENGVLNVASVRIRVVDQKVTEGEAVVGRKSDLTFDADALTATPPPAGPAAKENHTAREIMVAAANSYFEGIQQHKSSIVQAHKGCNRVENGLTVTGRPIANARPDGPAYTDCANSMEGFQSTILEVVHRRYPVVDEEAGVVFGSAVFNRPPGAKRPNGDIYPRNLLTEIFVIEKGRIRGIYAAMHYMSPDKPQAPNWD